MMPRDNAVTIEPVTFNEDNEDNVLVSVVTATQAQNIACKSNHAKCKQQLAALRISMCEHKQSTSQRAAAAASSPDGRTTIAAIPNYAGTSVSS